MAAAAPAFGCDLCAVYNVAAAHGELEKGFFAGVAEQFTHFGTLQEDGDEIRDRASQRLDSSITQVLGGYTFSQYAGLQFNVPVIYRSFRRPEHLDIDRGTESGVGDISLALNSSPFRWESMHATVAWTVLGGVKLPTGDTDRLREELHEHEHEEGVPESGIHGHDLALGSGSVDAIIGSGLFARWRRLFFNGSVQYAIRTEGDIDYRFANDLTWNGGPGVFALMSETHTLGLQFVVSGEDKGYDRFQGRRADDTAITSVFLGPQLNFTWTDQLSAQFGIDLPVLLDNSAVQIVPDWRARAALTWRFH